MSVIVRMATDFVCPYCIAASIPLHQAIAERNDVTLELLPFELTPMDKSAVDTWNDPVRREKWSRDLVPFAEKIGLHAHFPPHVIPRPHTVLAWQGWHYACEKGMGDAYASLMYRAYFVDELNIGNMEILVSLANRIGLDKTDFNAVLQSGMYAEKQKAANAASHKLGITGVPTIWMNHFQLSDGLFTKEEFAMYLDAAAQGSKGSAVGFGGCGPDGC